MTVERNTMTPVPSSEKSYTRIQYSGTPGLERDTRAHRYKTILSSLLRTPFSAVIAMSLFIAGPMLAGAQSEASYRLHAGDVVTVSYRLSPEFNADLTIQPDGYVTLPMIGPVRLASETISEATDAVKKAASARLKNPQVTVTLKDFERPYVTVSGYVIHPGKVEVRGPLTTLRAVALAGGFSEGANRSQVLLIRPISETMGETKVIDLARSLKDRNQKVTDSSLKPGDMIFIPSDKLTRVTRYIKLANAGLYIPIN